MYEKLSLARLETKQLNGIWLKTSEGEGLLSVYGSQGNAESTLIEEMM